MTSDEGELTLRPADVEDLPELCDLYLRVRAAAVPAMPAQVRPIAEVRAWFACWDLARRETWLAQRDDGALLAYAVLEDDWLDSLYVAPEAAGQGIGTALLELAKQLRPAGFELWVFASNQPARRFYARHGLVELEHTDGADNEERAPDIRVAWPGRASVGGVVHAGAQRSRRLASFP
ncbi:GNAT family N-acetyltransferase [Nocardioides pacificus]